MMNPKVEHDIYPDIFRARMANDQIACTLCGHRTRKYISDMRRHWENKHRDKLDKGMEVKYKIALGVSGVDSLESHGFKRSTKEPSEENEQVGERVAEDGGLVIEDTGDENPEVEGVNEENDQGGGGDHKKRRRNQSDSEEEDVNANQRKKRKENVLELLLKKVSDMDEKLTDFDKKFETHKEAKTVKVSKEEQELTTERIDDILRKSQSIEELERVLEELGIAKEVEVDVGVDGYYCSVCFDGSQPNWKNKVSNIPGMFKLSRSELSDEGKETQNDGLRNLKKHIKGHLCKCKSHEEKMAIQCRKRKSDEDFQKRQVKAGMNVFLERYLGIQQSKSRLDFEEDCLRAKLTGTEIGDQNHSRFFAKKLDGEIYNEMKDRIKDNMNAQLEATGRKRPAGLLMDKMTPNKRTGQMHAVVIPLIENPLTQVTLSMHALHCIALHCMNNEKLK